MTPEKTVEWMQAESRKLTQVTGVKGARDVIDSFLRYHHRSRADRRAWLAYLFDGSASHPEAFSMMGEIVVGEARTDEHYADLIARGDWEAAERYMVGLGWPADVVADALAHVREHRDVAGGDDG